MTALTSWIVISASLLQGNAPPDKSALQRFDFSQRLMGIAFDISVYAPSETSANEAVEEAFGRIRRLNAIFSDYEPESELNRLCKTAGKSESVVVSPELWEILQHSVKLAEVTGGAFDVTVGPAVRLWRKARRTQQLPSQEQIQLALSAVGFQKLKLDPKKKSVELLVPGMQLDLGGIAVGYACDDVLKGFRKRGLTRVLINGSGDILAGDAPPGELGWTVGIATPSDEDARSTRPILLRNAACSTSGDLYQNIEFQGVRYSHIVDPKTGLGLTNRIMVTVIAPNCLSADAWSTTVSVLGVEKGMAFLAKQPDSAAVIMCPIPMSLEFQTIESPRFRSYLRKD